MFQTLTVEKQILSVSFISQVSFQICIVEDVALNRNVHSTILWHNQSNSKKSQPKDVKGQRQSMIRPLLFKMLSMDQTLRHQLASGQKHRISGPPQNMWIRSHIWQDQWGIWMHTEIWDLGHWFSNCVLWNTLGGPLWGVGQEEIRKKGDGEQASLWLSSLPVICLGDWTPPHPLVSYPIDTKVRESLFWTNHLIFYMHNWDLPNSIREFYQDHIIVLWTLLENSVIYKAWESRKVFIGSVAGITSQLQR